MRRCIMKRIILSILLVLVFVNMGMAEPTPKNTELSWDMPTPDSDLAGFYVYWVAQSSPKPYNFKGASRVQIADPLARSAIIIDVNPLVSGGLCFAVTAYDLSGNESEFAAYPVGKTDACGWFGMTAPSGVGIN